MPTVTGGTSTKTAAYAATWVGIDGFEDAQLQALFSGLTAQQQKQMILATETVEQIGTEQDWTGKTTDYYAWFEFYPNYSYEIVGFTVKPGDSISGSVTYLGSNKWSSKLTKQHPQSDGDRHRHLHGRPLLRRVDRGGAEQQFGHLPAGRLRL